MKTLDATIEMQDREGMTVLIPVLPEGTGRKKVPQATSIHLAHALRMLGTESVRTNAGTIATNVHPSQDPRLHQSEEGAAQAVLVRTRIEGQVKQDDVGKALTVVNELLKGRQGPGAEEEGGNTVDVIRAAVFATGTRNTATVVCIDQDVWAGCMRETTAWEPDAEDAPYPKLRRHSTEWVARETARHGWALVGTVEAVCYEKTTEEVQFAWVMTAVGANAVGYMVMLEKLCGAQPGALSGLEAEMGTSQTLH